MNGLGASLIILDRSNSLWHPVQTIEVSIDEHQIHQIHNKIVTILKLPQYTIYCSSKVALQHRWPTLEAGCSFTDTDLAKLFTRSKMIWKIEINLLKIIAKKARIQSCRKNSPRFETATGIFSSSSYHIGMCCIFL